MIASHGLVIPIVVDTSAAGVLSSLRTRIRTSARGTNGIAESCFLSSGSFSKIRGMVVVTVQMVPSLLRSSRSGRVSTYKPSLFSAAVAFHRKQTMKDEFGGI